MDMRFIYVRLFLGNPAWLSSFDILIAAKKLKNNGVMLLLFETPSGFALFSSSEVYFHLPNTLKVRFCSSLLDGRPSMMCFLFLWSMYADGLISPFYYLPLAGYLGRVC